jgi:phenylacetate-CoA ligase
MITVRGVNVYPTAIESVVRGFADVIEFRSTVSHANAMQRLAIEIELAQGRPIRTARRDASPRAFVRRWDSLCP